MCTSSFFTCQVCKAETPDKYNECDTSKSSASNGTPLPERHTVSRINLGYPPIPCSRCGSGPLAAVLDPKEFQDRLNALSYSNRSVDRWTEQTTEEPQQPPSRPNSFAQTQAVFQDFPGEQSGHPQVNVPARQATEPAPMQTSGPGPAPATMQRVAPPVPPGLNIQWIGAMEHSRSLPFGYPGHQMPPVGPPPPPPPAYLPQAFTPIVDQGAYGVRPSRDLSERPAAALPAPAQMAPSFSAAASRLPPLLRDPQSSRQSTPARQAAMSARAERGASRGGHVRQLSNVVDHAKARALSKEYEK